MTANGLNPIVIGCSRRSPSVPSRRCASPTERAHRRLSYPPPGDVWVYRLPMRLIQLGFALLFVVMGLGALAGRTATSEAVDTITPMAEAAPVTTMANVASPDAALAGDAVVANAAHSVVKVSSFAYSCQKV